MTQNDYTNFMHELQNNSVFIRVIRVLKIRVLNIFI